MNYDALLIVDMQTALVNKHPYKEDVLLASIQTLLNVCRSYKIPVIYIQHAEEEGSELTPGTAGYKIYDSITPECHEKVFQKHYNSAFRQTDLSDYLSTIGAKHLILCGLQTEYCIDATCKSAFEFEYEITIPEGGTSTFDNEFTTAEFLTSYYEKMIWDHRFASVVPLSQIIKDITLI